MSYTFNLGKYILNIIKPALKSEPINKSTAFILLCSSISSHAIYTYITSNTKEIIVKHKYTFNRNGFTEFMLIDDNNIHYSVDNTVWYLKFNSIEDYYNININNKIKVNYYGFRIPFLGLFPIIYKKID